MTSTSVAHHWVIGREFPATDGEVIAMMGWYGGWGGMSPFMWVFMALFWVGLIALIVWLVSRLLPGADQARHRPPAGPVESPEQVLDRLFAMGEIDEQTYRSRRTALTEMRRQS